MWYALRAGASANPQTITRYDSAYGQPEYSDYLQNGTATNEVGNICASAGSSLPYILVPQDGINLVATWQRNPIVLGLTLVSPFAFEWGQTLEPIVPTPITPCPGTLACAMINYNNLAYLQYGNLTDGTFTPKVGRTSPITIPLTVPTGLGSWQVQFYPDTGAPDLTIRGGAGCSLAASAGAYGYLTCSGNVTSVTLSNSATLSLSQVQVYVDGARV